MDRNLAARTGWFTYDEFVAPTLESGLWEPFDVGSGPRLEPEARTPVENGVVTVDVPRFMNCDATNQGLDNTKHLIITKQGFRLSADGSGDYRQGFATFTLADTTGGTHMVFNILSTGERIFAEQEVLPAPGQENPFTRVIEDPFFRSRAGSPPSPDFRRCEIEIDRSRGQVVWTIDGRILHEAPA